MVLLGLEQKSYRSPLLASLKVLTLNANLQGNSVSTDGSIISVISYLLGDLIFLDLEEINRVHKKTSEISFIVFPRTMHHCLF